MCPTESCCLVIFFFFTLDMMMYHSWQWELTGCSFLGTLSIAICLLLMMYAAPPFGEFSVSLLLHVRLRWTSLLCTCTAQPRGGAVLCSRAGGLWRSPCPEGTADWAGKWRIGAYCPLIPRLKRMQRNKKHSVKDSHVDKCRIFLLQLDFSLLLGNKTKCFWLHHKV